MQKITLICDMDPAKSRQVMQAMLPNDQDRHRRNARAAWAMKVRVSKSC